jgi:hypothetical protein
MPCSPNYTPSTSSAWFPKPSAFFHDTNNSQKIQHFLLKEKGNLHKHQPRFAKQIL